MNHQIKTPRTHPDHHVVGRFWGAHSIKNDKSAIYRCIAYDPARGYWMVNVHDSWDKRCISERAINANYWPADDKGDRWYITQWGTRVYKDGRIESFAQWYERDKMPRQSKLAL